MTPTADGMIFVAFAIFCVKHFVVDFLLQPPWMFRSKHIFGHPGGLAHAGLHSVVTWVLLVLLLNYGIVGPWAYNPWPNELPSSRGYLPLSIALLEFPIHYMIDWLKMNAGRAFRWKPDTHPQFWYALGFDQLLHYLTYLGLLAWWFLVS